MAGTLADGLAREVRELAAQAQKNITDAERNLARAYAIAGSLGVEIEQSDNA